MVVKRVVDTDEGKDEVEEGAPSRDELYKLTDQALRQVPGSAAQQEIIKQLNVVREKLGMKKLVEKETISDSLIETTLDFAHYTIDSLTPVIEEDFETPMKIDARRKVFRQKAKRLGYKKVKEDGHADVASALGQIGIVRAALEKMSDHLSIMNKEDDLPTWLTNKIATATDRLDTAADYLGSRKEVQESTEEVDEVSLVNVKNEIETIKQRLAQAAKNKQSKEVAKLKKTLKSLEKKKKKALNASTENLEEKKIAGLVKKADKSGIPYGILKQVYNRGMAAWKTGHRPGTTPQQWAFARVNSFVTKSKGTWGGADKDLAAKARKAKK